MKTEEQPKTAMELLEEASWHPETDELMTRAPDVPPETFKATIEKFRKERASWRARS